MKYAYIESPFHNPYDNLAAEQVVFDCLPRDRAYFMLWRNEPSVIIGKFQNAAAEVNLSAAKEAGVLVARRLSGGGAVYHDLGNVNYTLISDTKGSPQINMRLFCEPLARTLQDLGLPAQISGRNDVTIDGAKCSGSAQYVKDGRVMHHGCILFDTDLSVLPKMLNFRPEKYSLRGVKSVASRVVKIRPLLKEDLSIEAFMAVLRDGMLNTKESESHAFSTRELKAIQRLSNERYRTWEWNIGKSPALACHRGKYIEGCGFVEIYLDVAGGRIRDFCSRGDYFAAADQEALRQLLVGTPMTKEALRELLSTVNIGRFYQGLSREAFIDLLLASVQIAEAPPPLSPERKSSQHRPVSECRRNG